MPVKKTTIKRTVKKYLTVRNAWISGIVFGILTLINMAVAGWSIRETKGINKAYNDVQKELKKVSDDQRRVIELDRIRDSALYERLSKNNTERQKAVSSIQTQKDERIKKIFSPDFSSNDDSIRAAFANE